MATQNNAAYDLSVYEPKVRREEQSVELKVVKKQSQAAMSPIKLIMVIVLMVSLTIGMIYNRVRLSEVEAEINSAERELTQLKTEGNLMEEKLNNMMSVTNIEKEALALGMVKLKPDDIKYISIETDDGVELAEKESPGVIERIKNIFSDIREYLGL